MRFLFSLSSPRGIIGLLSLQNTGGEAEIPNRKLCTVKSAPRQVIDKHIITVNHRDIFSKCVENEKASSL